MGKRRNRNKALKPQVIGAPKVKHDNSAMGEAMFGNQFTIGGGFGTQLSRLDTIFENNRWFLISNMRQILSEIYVEHGIIKTVVDVPVDDGFRGGITIDSKELSPQDIELLNNTMERNGDLVEAAQACKWKRLFGGAAILIMTDEDPVTELKPDDFKKGGKLEFRAVDMWELYYAQQNINEPNQNFDNVEYFNYYGINIHRSRVLIMKGLEAPSFIRPKLRGWGVSVVEDIVRSINQYLKSNNLSFEVLDEFKLDVYGFEGLNAALLSPDGVNKVYNRVQIANMTKNYQNALVLDKEDVYNSKQLSFTGISEAMKEIRLQLAADLRMPLTKVFGMSSAGFNSGEDDIENYNAMVESTIRTKVKFEIQSMVEIRCQQLFGFIPADLRISFKPLRIMSSEQEENVKTQRFNRVLQARQAGYITDKEFAEACNKDQLLPIKIGGKSLEDDMEGEDPEIEVEDVTTE